MNDTTVKKRHKKSRLPFLAQTGPVSVWMILFVTIPMLFIIFISLMSRDTYGGIDYTLSGEAYVSMLDPVYFKVILKSFGIALITTGSCLILGYPFAYYIARKPPRNCKPIDNAFNDSFLDKFPYEA